MAMVTDAGPSGNPPRYERSASVPGSEATSSRHGTKSTHFLALGGQFVGHFHKRQKESLSKLGRTLEQNQNNPHIVKVSGLRHLTHSQPPYEARVRGVSQIRCGTPEEVPEGFGIKQHCFVCAAGEGNGSHRPSGSQGGGGQFPTARPRSIQKRHVKADSRTPASPSQGYVNPHMPTEGEAP